MEIFKALFKLYFAYYLRFVQSVKERWELFITPIRLAREKNRLRKKGYSVSDDEWAGLLTEFSFCKCFIIRRILFPNFYAIKNSAKWDVQPAQIALNVGIFRYDEILWIFVPRTYDRVKHNDLEKIEILLAKFPQIRYERLEDSIKIFGYKIDVSE